MDKKSLGKFIKTRRDELEYTQQELADILGVTDKTVSKWELGRSYPDIELLEPIAEALKTDIATLFEESKKPESKMNINGTMIASVAIIVGCIVAAIVLANGRKKDTGVASSKKMVAVDEIQTEATTAVDDNALKIKWPLEGDNTIITSEFGIRTLPENSGSIFHEGIDITFENGALEHIGEGIVSGISGYVYEIGKDDKKGNYVTISSDDNKVLITYAHCDSVAVKLDDKVETGTVIASFGNTGEVTGSCVCLSVRVNGEYVDPIDYLYH